MRHVRTDVLHREIRLVALGCGVKLWQLIKEEVARRYANVVRDPRRLRMKAIAFEAYRDDRVVVRPDRAGLIVMD